MVPTKHARFDWRNSPAHMGLLANFLKPRDVDQVANWQYLKTTLGEAPSAAIARFVRDGALNQADLVEGLEQVFTVAQLKQMLKVRGLKLSGSKSELIERLVAADRPGMESSYDRSKLLTCSLEARVLVEQFLQERQQEEEAAKHRSFDALLRDDIKDALKSHASYAQRYFGGEYVSNSYLASEMAFILTCKPKVLGSISQENLRALQAAVCLSRIWRDERAVNWLSDDFHTELPSNQVAVNYLSRHVDIHKVTALESEYASRFQLIFEPGDIDSCELCLALRNTVFEKDALPELPLEGCSSDTGCMCHFRSVYEDSALSFEDDLDELDETPAVRENADPVTTLLQLKEMLNLDLITQEEYNAKKADVLARM